MMRTLFFAFLILLFVSPAKADDFNYKAFSELPVQHGGRIKPVDSFALGMLEILAAKDSASGMNADQWLAQTLFDPARALGTPTFRLLKPEILDLPARKGRLYSYAEIVPALQKKAQALQKLAVTEEKNWSDDQKELARIQDVSVLYGQLLRSFSFILPLDLRIPPLLAKEWGLKTDAPPTLQDLKPHAQKLERRLKNIIGRKGEDPSRYSEEEKQIAILAFEIQTLEAGGTSNVLFRILPATTSGNNTWYSPWESQERGEGSPQNAAYLSAWKNMARAYNQKTAGQWKEATDNARRISESFDGADKIPFELFYNALHPFGSAVAAYLLSFLLLIIYHARPISVFIRASFVFLGLGAFIHTCGIILRVIILSRPPVGTLYESILFVALVCVIAALIYEFRSRDGNGLLMGAISGLLLLFCAGSFSSEDSMGVLVAVLNTNFWLATHVLCITMGYAFCLLSSMAAHIWLALKAKRQNGDGMIFPVKSLVLLSLLLTTVGTILGGIWADQSWGRFWGWDPKENGALLIVLWLIWLLHGQIAGQISRSFFMAGIAALSIVVAIAWFGVNLLSTGLHSYGFINGVAAALFTFCALQAAVIFWLMHKGKSAA